MSVFSSSSQSQRWIFGSHAALIDARISAHMQRAAPASAAAETTISALTEDERAELAERIEEDDYILHRFSRILQDCCGPTEAHPIKRSWKVAATATAYLRRFYVRNSLADHDPRVVMPTCLFLAGKAEEGWYIDMATLVDKLKCSPEDTVRYEVTVLSDIEFDLRVYHPQGCIDAILSDFAAAQQSPAATLSVATTQPLPRVSLGPILRAVESSAKGALDSLQLTPVLLLHSPAHIAVSVLLLLFEGTEEAERFKSYLQQRYGAAALQRTLESSGEVQRHLEKAKEDIDEEKFKKIMKKIKKRSAWGGK